VGHDEGLDARERMEHTSAEIVAMVRHAVMTKPTPRALYRAQIARATN
jgi:hypothetical protein